MPGLDTVIVFWIEVKPLGPDQKPTAPGVLIVPTIVTSVTEQVNVPPPVMATCGDWVFCATNAVAVDVQPFGPVTVRM